ncbi:2-amino-4-hydroxy-6-hydroxymethyldihydropteridine diphosphokinase [Mergibacter septicus]|uniref:2-amino-4-hydroxy-6-hydroxymethyldihydropteridine pyrophosphokinase n=1 Tax=Mergibacter septicus TaxID=221402 RepID=A0A8E3MF70_9PAST|nr:2-amino-4-hydroxy-6-hydroxymethyldihydropteridine diphosphokinase [Mergibacter septicus]AWX15040.1 2-amino-4-hydroxy-6-hydroxymethyldihydropteridine diphosphokinase [Mergibacter septicus]QDJ14292.1 2-amino-4-hydroxy-6-hydroxymethyldihydropteridine diphosphokinase [Mergibacter septicus]UTU48267.1 2-amino-4-hydroxy-6-hydroxymethyldihydropteridine diphosphokinase [Mergibacter septicus]WMR96115.1 2-amino-4-hydroxy-6-hydroxymethyldihydropteridine diphosphokinase [Mergibacter septicus]
MNLVYIGLGSNLADPIAQLQQAVKNLATLPDTEVVTVSSFYRSKPLGPQDQPDYINAVLALKTNLSPLTLLEKLQQIEQQQGRVRLRRWGERTLDLDILLYNQEVIQTERLVVPHYDMHNRAFVILPLYQIAPNLILPTGQALAELAKQFDLKELERLA